MDDLCWANGAEKSVQCQGKTLLIQPVEQAVPIAAYRYQVRGGQDGQMPRNGRAGDTEPRRDVSGSQFSPLEFFENLSAGRVRQRPEDF